MKKDFVSGAVMLKGRGPMSELHLSITIYNIYFSMFSQAKTNGINLTFKIRG